MLQSKIRIKLKKKYVKDDSSNKKTSQKNLKLFNCDEKNREKIERMKEKIKIIQEKISSFKDSQITTTKRKSNNKNAIEKNLSEGEINHEKIKDIKLLNKKNLKLNFNQCEQFKSAYQSYSNNFYTNTRQKKPNNKISEDKSMNYTQNFSSHQKDYYLFKKKKDNLKKKCNNNDSNIIDSTYREKYNQLKNKGNYSIDKENISLDKNINFNSLEINHIYNHIKKDFIYPYLPSKNKIYSEKNKKIKLILFDEIKSCRPISYTKKKNKNINLSLNLSKDISSYNNNYSLLNQLNTKNVTNLFKETPSTRNTVKSEIKIYESNIINAQNKKKKENKKHSKNNKSLNISINDNSKKLKKIYFFSKAELLDKKINKINNSSFEKNSSKIYKNNMHNLPTQKKISNELKKDKKPFKHSNQKSLLINCSKYIASELSITNPSTKRNQNKNIITLKKSSSINKIEIPYDTFNQKKKINVNKLTKKKKNSNYNPTKNTKNKVEKNTKTIKIEKPLNQNSNKTTSFNNDNFRTIQSNFNESKEKEIINEKTLPHVFSVILKKRGNKKKEYPNMVFKTSSSQGDITKIKKNDLKNKKTKYIKDIQCICKKGFSGPGIKKTNQDNYFIFNNFLNNKNYSYIGVCDGHGIYGQDISTYLVDNLPINLNTDLLNQNIISISSEKIHNISKYINSSFIQTNINLNTDERIDSTYSGSTCSSLILTPKKLISINVGDSRCILGKYNNKKWFSKILTRDHKPSDSDEKERIILAGGRVAPFRDQFGNLVGPKRVWKKGENVPGLAMSRSFGDEVGHEVGVIVDPEIYEYEFVKEDKFIVVGSDGLWEFISNEEVVNIVKKFYEDNDIKGALDYLYKEASKRWIIEEEIIDDITIILVFFN